MTSSRNIDVLIVTAIKLEYDAVRDVCTDAVDGRAWDVIKGSKGFDVAFKDFHSKDAGVLRVAVTYALEMGGVATAIAAQPLIQEYSPRCLAMCGVCAGRRGDVQLGDVIVGDRLWTYDSGTTVFEPDEFGDQVSRFKADPIQYNLSAQWKQRAEGIVPDIEQTWLKARPFTFQDQGDWLLARIQAGEDYKTRLDRMDRCSDFLNVVLYLRERGLLSQEGLTLSRRGLRHIEEKNLLNPDGWPDRKPFAVHVGPIGTGTQVVRDPDIFKKLSFQMRKVLGLEMEASAIGAVAHMQNLPQMIVMKGVMDYADGEKNDNFKNFAARASAECLIAFLRENLESKERSSGLRGKLAGILSISAIFFCVWIYKLNNGIGEILTSTKGRESAMRFEAAVASHSCQVLTVYSNSDTALDGDRSQARNQLAVWKLARNSAFKESTRFESGISASLKPFLKDKCANLAVTKGLSLISANFQCELELDRCTSLTCTFSGDVYAPTDC